MVVSVIVDVDDKFAVVLLEAEPHGVAVVKVLVEEVDDELDPVCAAPDADDEEFINTELKLLTNVEFTDDAAVVFTTL